MDVRLITACLLIVMSSVQTPVAFADKLRFQGSCKPTTSSEPQWVSRCYNGNVTLSNFDSIESLKHRLASHLAWRVTEELVGFQAPDASGQMVSGDQVLALSLFLMTGGHLGWAHDVTADGTDIRFTGPVVAGTGFDTHQRVRIFYSDEVVHWLKRGREGDIPDGSVIVKQMYASDPTEASYGADRVSGWAVMIKNSKLSHDGWIWYLFFFPGSPPYNAPLPVVYAQTGDSFCLSCHSAADNAELTFSSIENLEGVGQQYTWIDEGFPSLFSSLLRSQQATLAGGNTVETTATYASGVAQFQRAGLLTEKQQAALSEFEKDAWHDLKNGLKGIDDDSFKTISNDLAQNNELSSVAIPEGLEALLEKILLNLGKAIKDHDLRGALSYSLQDYWRLITQAQTTTPLPKPDELVVNQVGADAITRLQDGQARFDWFPLDFIYTHTPALPDSIPAELCAQYKGRLLKKDEAGKEVDCRDVYITADNCNGCHWSYVLQGNEMPHLVEIDPFQSFIDEKLTAPIQQNWPIMSDYSQYNEWSASMMGLAGKDPIFHAQLSWERENRPEQADQISNFCLRCHQAGAQRQFHLDNGDAENKAVIYPPEKQLEYPLFTESFSLQEPVSKISAEAKYGALGREGITCTVCHTIQPEGLGKKETFTGQFNYPTLPGELYGPYATDDVSPYYMEQAIGLTPAHGAQITDAGLCGSCHTVITPILSDRAGDAGDEYRTTYEQTTYPEWLNSVYNAEHPDSGAQAQTCQECHMPSTLPGSGPSRPGPSRPGPSRPGPPVPLTEIIANVETQYLPDLPNRAEDAKLDLTPKPYRRHTLLGLNVFANQMFQQFPQALGNSMKNTGGVPAKAQLKLAEEEMISMGETQTIALTVTRAGQQHSQTLIDVTVENLTGHKFPTGVGFRRAFIELKVLDENGDTIWASGSVNGAGQITDGRGEVIPQERTRNPAEILTGTTIIESEAEAYIFESRLAHVNAGTKGEKFSDLTLTTSFLEIAKEVKDTRLLPKGWSPAGPYADVTQSRRIIGEGDNKRTEPFVPSEPGKRVIRYIVDTGGRKIADVTATMIYQAIPPYYISDRLQYDTQAIRRFYYMVANLKTEGTVIEDWAFRIKCASDSGDNC